MRSCWKITHLHPLDVYVSLNHRKDKPALAGRWYMPSHLHSERQFAISRKWIFRCCLAHLYRSIFWGCIYSRENGHQFAKIEPIFQLFSFSHRFEDESLAVKCCSFNLPSCAKVAQFAKGLLEKKRTTETIAYVMLKCSSL